MFLLLSSHAFDLGVVALLQQVQVVKRGLVLAAIVLSTSTCMVTTSSPAKDPCRLHENLYDIGPDAAVRRLSVSRVLRGVFSDLPMGALP